MRIKLICSIYEKSEKLSFCMHFWDGPLTLAPQLQFIIIHCERQTMCFNISSRQKIPVVWCGVVCMYVLYAHTYVYGTRKGQRKKIPPAHFSSSWLHVNSWQIIQCRIWAFKPFLQVEAQKNGAVTLPAGLTDNSTITCSHIYTYVWAWS